MPFEKGKSGNPGGRPKGKVKAIREMLEPHMPELWDELLKLAKNSKSEKVKLTAISDCFDRYYGKAIANVQVENVGPPPSIIFEVPEHDLSIPEDIRKQAEKFLQ